MEHCACAGEWVSTQKREEIRSRLKVYGNVARFFQLVMLEAVVTECVEGF